MIKASAKAADGRHLLVLGLSDGNIERLKQGMPIYFDTVAMNIPAGETIGHITIIWGHTEADMARDLHSLIGPETHVISIPRGSDTEM